MVKKVFLDLSLNLLKNIIFKLQKQKFLQEFGFNIFKQLFK